LDLLPEAIGVAHHLPRALEGEGDGRRGRAAQIVRGDGAHGLERRLGQEGPERTRILAFPALELEEEGGGKDQLDSLLDLAPKDHAPVEERLEAGRERRDQERAAGLGDAVKELTA